MIKEFRDQYFFLSNFYTHEFTYDGRTYQNAEAAFQSMKAPKSDRGKYSNVQPNVAKRMGRKENLPQDWATRSEDVMLEIVRTKFSDPMMAKRLLDTGTQALIEGNNWHDNKWGDCTCPKCRNNPGSNKLGMILMQIRDELKSQA